MPATIAEHRAAVELGPNARLAAETTEGRATRGIPNTGLNLMHVPLLEEVAGHAPGSYREDPETVYLGFQRRIGACKIDQFIPRNPLTMAEHGYGKATARTATTGAERTVLDGIAIDSPEAVAEHLERFVFPKMERQIAEATGAEAAEAAAAELIEAETATQRILGGDILKAPYGKGFNNFPKLRYGAYGYVNYFMAFALYPEVLERDFALQGELAAKQNAVAVRAYERGRLPRILRLDHDMASGQGTFVKAEQLDALWFPHFARAIKPYVDAGVRLLWHCDGNLMKMVPRLIEAGVSGFQGFQYECGMDYEAICRMTDRAGRSLLIQAGVSVTTTLPHGTPADVRRQLEWLVQHGPRTGLFLGASSSITPGTNPENVRVLLEGLRHYRENGRGATSR